MAEVAETTTTGLAVYMRVSGDEQRRQGTIENQHVAADRYLTAHAMTAYGTYEDDGVTGTLLFAGRPAGSRLLADVRAGHVTMVLVTKLDRFGRNAREILNAVHELEQAGARLISIKENVDTRTIAGKFFLTVLSGVAELERDMILERTAEGKALRLESSPWMGGHPPLGFHVEGEKKHAHLAINNHIDDSSGYSEVDAVRLGWYLLLEQDWSTERIAAHLTQLGIPTRTPGGEWATRTVFQMFRNPIYKGERHYRTKDGQIIVRPVTDDKGVSLALVSVADWDRAQAVLAAHRASPTRASAQTTSYTG